MHEWVPFWPRNAALSASIIDTINIGEFALIALILVFVFGMMITFGVRYRHGSARPRTAVAERSWRFEIGWTSATIAAFFVLFVLGANAYLFLYEAPRHQDLELYVVGKQWMWKIEHPGGQREIDAMHVPLGSTVRVVLASEDVIHSLFIPAFRLKHDVVPGQFETFWFRATRTGSYQLECSEFCGTQHAHMRGTVTVMRPAAYARWLTDQGVAESLAQRGFALFRKYGCSGCHGTGSDVHAPSLAGLYGSIAHLADGRAVRADERYIRDCILIPQTQRVAGYPPVMPSFQGQLSEEDLINLLAYIQSLSEGPRP
ncbi:MAG TPA: c-type cytochrome [Steroidobacteraceae bacterium]|nr:c-type cytochrome [Steroidobacteraceae bacterium]